MKDPKSGQPVDVMRRRVAHGALGAVLAPALLASPSSSSSNSVPSDVAREDWHGELKHIDAGELRICYADMGKQDAHAILLLHGWPYDIQTYSSAAILLVEAGYRVLVPYLRGFGQTLIRSTTAPRNGQQSIFAMDALNLLDALNVQEFTVAGCDWGARTANIMAALWPTRCNALVSVSGYLIGSQATGQRPLAPEEELKWWYQFYFSTDRGRRGYEANRTEFARLIWKLASPSWNFDECTFRRTALSFENPDHVDIVIHNYRWRLGLAEGNPALSQQELLLAQNPTISIPTITLEGDANGAPHPDSDKYRAMFTGDYEHRVVYGGVGHNLPQEAPEAFAAAVIDAARRGLQFRSNIS